ncbi:MICAL-like protein 1 [Chanos chanos]|uniref:MICAL-like protein 1 n=1 Tax=Chanos chanos TaxID=29144 RepID=A0A6J2WYE4_CHACN|nr:MICAL-like protein 1 [Chanos chanos]
MGSLKSLQEWCRLTCKDYPNVEIRNMTTSFRDGLAFCAIIHKHRPDLIDFHSLSKDNVYENNCLAFEVAESQLGIPALLDAEDMLSTEGPDRLGVITYLSQYYSYFTRKSHGPASSLKTPVLSEFTADSQSREPKQHKLLSAERPSVAESENKDGRLSSSCRVCQKRVHLVQRVLVQGKLYHRTCFRCSQCSCMLLPGSYREVSETGSLVCALPCSPSQSGPHGLCRSTRFNEGLEQDPEQEVIPPENGQSNQPNQELSGRTDLGELPHGTEKSEDQTHCPSCNDGGISEEVKTGEKGEGISSQQGGGKTQETGPRPSPSRDLTTPEQPVPPPRRRVDPPQPAPRTRSSRGGGRATNSVSTEFSKPLSPPWMELIQPGPWAKLPPAPAPTPPPRSCSIPTLSEVWLKRWASPFNPFDEDAAEGAEGAKDDGTFRAVLERDESQTQLTMVASQSWCGPTQLTEAAATNGVSVSDLTNVAVSSKANDSNDGKSDTSVHKSVLAKADSTVHLSTDDISLDESSASVALDLAKAESSHCVSGLAEATGVAILADRDESSLAETASSPGVSDLAEAGSVSGVSGLDRPASAGQSDSLGSLCDSLSEASLCSETNLALERSLPLSISEPAISSANHQFKLTDNPSPSNLSANQEEPDSSCFQRPASLLKDNELSSSVGPVLTKRTCKENPFNRKASLTELPKSSPTSAPSNTRAPAPGHGFPLIKRKVQSDQYVAAEELQEELGELENKLVKLELRGVEMEKNLRICHNDKEEDDLLVDWFTLIHEKHMLVRRDAELVYLAKQQNLEERQADVEYELRCLLNKPEREWSTDDNLREKQLMEELVSIIEQRNCIINSMDQDRQREQEEDMLLAAVIQRRDFQKQAERGSGREGGRGRFRPLRVLRMLGHRTGNAKGKNKSSHVKKS